MNIVGALKLESEAFLQEKFPIVQIANNNFLTRFYMKKTNASILSFFKEKSQSQNQI